MDLNLLKTFYQVAKLSSFTKASHKLFITQPAVTSQIKSLEESLGGVTLFKRIGRKIFLTDEGKILFRYASSLMEIEKELKEIFTDLSKGIRGTITIGATSVMGTYYLPKILGKFKGLNPFIEIKTFIANSKATIENVLNGNVDLAIAGIPQKLNDNLVAKFFHSERMVFIISPEHELTAYKSVPVESLLNVPFLTREMGTITRTIVEKWLKEHKLHRNISIELGNVEAVKRMVEEGFGATIIPEIAVKREVEAGLLKVLDVENFNLKIDYYLIYPKNTVLPKACRAFIDFIYDKS